MLDIFRHRIGQLVGLGALDRRIGEGADAVELRLLEELQQQLEVLIGLAGKAGDEGAANSQFRADGAPGADARQDVLAGRFISLRMRGLACWKGTSR